MKILDEKTNSRGFTFYEFFAGGGMARAGLGDSWKCLLANDFDPKKSNAYAKNWGSSELLTGDVRRLSVEDIPGRADLAWASFPCQDLSLAGGGAGLEGNRSGTFWPFWKLIESLYREKRAPKTVVLENVCGTITSHQGRDFVAICKALHKSNFKFGALVIDAAHFVPQSRPRLFIIAVRQNCSLPKNLISAEPSPVWHTFALRAAHEQLPSEIKKEWIWWNLRTPSKREKNFSEIIEPNPSDVSWHTSEETKKLLAMMSSKNRAKVEQAQKTGRRMIGAIYKRTRHENGRKVQRAEVRFDLSGCLRTPAGGSSRQLILVVNGSTIKSRLISSRETARLMGLPECYVLPNNYNDAYHLTGDGVVVSVVNYLARHILEPIIKQNTRGYSFASVCANLLQGTFHDFLSWVGRDRGYKFPLSETSS